MNLFVPLQIRPHPTLLPELLRLLQGALQRWRRQREADDMRRSLAQLDDRTLHDLGLHRSEIGSLAAEHAGLAYADRRQALHRSM